MKTGRARITEDPVNILLLLRPPADWWGAAVANRAFFFTHSSNCDTHTTTLTKSLTFQAHTNTNTWVRFSTREKQRNFAEKTDFPWGTS